MNWRRQHKRLCDLKHTGGGYRRMCRCSQRNTGADAALAEAAHAGLQHGRRADPHLCVRQTMQRMRAQVLRLRSLKPYTPDFKTAFEHFCIHPGGKTVIQGVGSQVLSPSPVF